MTTRYKFEAVFQSDTNVYQSTTTKEFDADEISEVLENFREFLLGVGFSPKIVEEYTLDE